MGNASRTTQSDVAQSAAAQLRTVLSKLKRKMREHRGQDDLTPSRTSVLLRLETDGPATVSNLARAEGIRPQSMSAIIAPLQQAGLVNGSPDPNDKRQTLISLTKKCHKLIQERRTAKQDWFAAIIRQKLSIHEQQKLATAIDLLARLAED